MLERDRLAEALATLGALLEERGEAIGVLIVGGGSLLLLGVVERPTADVDVVGFSSAAGYARADVLPEFLTTAVRDVGDALGLGDAWFNTGPAGLLEFGLEGQRWNDYRRFNRLNQLPLDKPTHFVAKVMPIPQAECDARVTKPNGC